MYLSWGKRDLSLLGKVQLIKTFALAQFVLQATLLVIYTTKCNQTYRKYVVQFLMGWKGYGKAQKGDTRTQTWWS